jgi:hypothetical protein
MSRNFATLGSLELQPPLTRAYPIYFHSQVSLTSIGQVSVNIQPLGSVCIDMCSRSQLKRYFAEFLQNGSSYSHQVLDLRNITDFISECSIITRVGF